MRSPWILGDTGRFLTPRAGGLLVVSSDGVTWTTQASPTDKELFAITFGRRGFVAVAGVDAIAASADGHEWTAVRVTG